MENNNQRNFVDYICEWNNDLKTGKCVAGYSKDFHFFGPNHIIITIGKFYLALIWTY